MHILDICKKDSGRIWNRKMNKRDNGVIVKIQNRSQIHASEKCGIIRFTHIDFSRNGDSFIAADCRGHVYYFNLAKNRFCFIQKIGSPCTALCFKLGRGTEFLIGCLADYTMKCFDTDTKELISTMRGHQNDLNNGDGGPIRDIAAHSNGHLVVSSGDRIAQLWDIMSFTRLRRLNINSDVAISKAFFLSTSNTLITCFKDDTIFAWETDTMSHKFELKAGRPNTSETKVKRNCAMSLRNVEENSKNNKSIHNFRSFASSKDGKLLCAGGKASYIHMWDLHDSHHQRILQLSAKESVKQLVFVEHCFTDAIKILGILLSDGIMKFVRLDTCKILFEIGPVHSPISDKRIISVALTSTRRQIAAINEIGEITLYDIDNITDDLSKPPIPISTFMDEVPKETLKKVKIQTTPANQISLLSERIRLAPPPPLHLPPGICMSKLLAILKEYGEYPAKYRLFIWRSLLRIPENHEAYASLIDKGTHPRFENLHETFPLKSKKMNRILQRILSALAYWSPIFGESDFIPLFVFPFVKLSENNQLVCFEIIASLLINWTKHWFEYFPSPPINVLTICENLLAYHDKKLLNHFYLYSVTSQIYAWPILESIFSEVLTREEWLMMMDHLISGHSSIILFAVVSYCIISRSSLLKCTNLDDFKYFFRHRNAVDMKKLINEIYVMTSTTPDILNPLLADNNVADEEFEMAPGYTPLTSPSYPIFNKYPKFIVDYQIKERDRIKLEEQEYLVERTKAIELEQQSLKRQNQENTWCRQQDMLLKAEDKRREIMKLEQQKLQDQRKKLESLTKDLKIKQIQSMDATRQQFIEYQHKQKLAEIARMDHQIRHKNFERSLEKEKVLNETDLKQMELKLTNNDLEKELHVNYNETKNHQNINKNHIKMLKEYQKENNELQDKVKDLKSQLQNLNINKDSSDDSTEYENIQTLQTNPLPERFISEIYTNASDCNDCDETTIPPKIYDNKYTTVSSPRKNISSDLSTQIYDSSKEARRILLSKSERNNDCLNNSLTTNSSEQFCLDRSGRNEFEKDEMELIQDVRRLRQKLATNKN